MAVAADSAEASGRLAAAMPQYEALVVQPHDAAHPAWLAEPALSARVQFLCSMLAPCARHLPEASP